MEIKPEKYRNSWHITGDRVQKNEFSFIVYGENYSLFRGIVNGDGLIISENSNITLFASIYRVRSTEDFTTIYFDKKFILQNKLTLYDIGIDLKGEDTIISRVEWPTFESAVKTATDKDFSALPVIKGDNLQEQAYIRELMELAVIDDILGPANGPEEEIVGMSVRDRYLVGKLSPQTGDAEDNIEGLKGPLALDETGEDAKKTKDFRPLEEVGEGKDKGARRTLPGEEFSGATGTADTENDEVREIDASKNQSFVPSSFGLTFCVDGKTDTIDIEARWGRYERTTSEEKTDKDDKPLRAWKRIPSGGVVHLSLKPGTINPIAPDGDCPHVFIQGTIRPPLPNGERLVTIFIVNDQTKAEKNQDEKWVFQPELTVRHPDKEPVFRRRPASSGDSNDLEQKSMDMIYRRRVEFAVGHGISVHSEVSPTDPERSAEIRTCVIPKYEVAVTETPGLAPEDRPAMRGMIERGFLDMTNLAKMPKPELIAALSVLADDYSAWIVERSGRISKDLKEFEACSKSALESCQGILERLREGIATLDKNDKALKAFQFANSAMAAQRVHSIYALSHRRGETVELSNFEKPSNHSWRPFQLAFILLSIPAVSDPTHNDRTKPVDAIADLLWFPTGGGKTEAYLGVAAFTMAIRRLQGNLGGLDASRGLSVIMRYTLRLLTVQQFQRASSLICAMEAIRRADEKAWGASPFTLGLWVGQRVTPNDTEEAHEAIEAERSGKRPTSSTPAQLTNCPWCGSEIVAGRDIEVRRFDGNIGRTLIYCGDKLGRCEFSRAKSKDLGIPILVVDDEIYRFPPSMLIATVDKFAMMAWRGQVRTLFGRASNECLRHGLLWPESPCSGKHTKRVDLPSVDAKKVDAIRPPDLIIQDELHLISGPLGTMVGLYETAVDELSSWKLGDKTVRPKVIASTATVRKAADQINNIFLRRVSIFPPHGLDAGDDFFSVQRPVSEKPGRRYLGICSPGSARPAVLIRLYTAMLTAAQALFEKFGQAADPWMTVVGYFNSLRELGGMRRLAEDDVQTRSYRVQMGGISRPGLAQRNVKTVDELTSRVSNKDIPRKLDQLEVPFKGVIDPDTGLYKQTWVKDEARAIDVVLATNMLGVGVDVKRLGLMAVNGQPKSTAEYIQATSRIGRFFPGLVFTVLTWSRPRDLSHYETFEYYHSTFYKHVEAQSVTPFAPRALDRGLTGTMISCLRLDLSEYNPNLGAGKMNSVSKTEAVELKKKISGRGGRVTGSKEVEKLVEDMVGARCDAWVKEANKGGRRLGYEAGRQKQTGQDDIAGLLKRPGHALWDNFTVPLSLREVEPGVRLVMNSDKLPDGPLWRVRPKEDSQKGGAE